MSSYFIVIKITQLVFILITYNYKATDSFIHRPTFVFTKFKPFDSSIWSSKNSIITRRLSINPYDGPKSKIEIMELLYFDEKLGIQIYVGPSILGLGKGLFFSIPTNSSEECSGSDCIILNKGTCICDYNDGIFVKENVINDSSTANLMDKCVDYAFKSVYTGIILNDTVMPLIDAIVSIYDRDFDLNISPISKVSNSINENRKSLHKESYISKLVYGHVLSSDENDDLRIELDTRITNRVYIPKCNNSYLFDNISKSPFLLSDSNKLGVYANDFGFNSSLMKSKTDECIYNEASRVKNILTLLWRVTYNQSTKSLMPVCPVVVISKDINLTRLDVHECIEVGLHYGWDYWSSLLPM